MGLLTPGSVRHRLQGTVNVPLIFGLRTNVNISAQSVTPYTITTGRDDNGDGTSNDRPAGVGRNTERGTATFVTNLRVSRAFALGGQRTGGGFPGGRGPGGPGGGGIGPGGPAGGAGASAGQTLNAQGQGGGRGAGGGGRAGNPGDAAFNARYMMELFVTADNVFNRVNYGGYSGNLLSDYFGQPTMAQRPRQVQIGMSSDSDRLPALDMAQSEGPGVQSRIESPLCRSPSSVRVSWAAQSPTSSHLAARAST